MSTDAITYGTGTYGDPVKQTLDKLKRLVLICGTTRTGKTRLANSVARQESAILGAGQVIINWKPDPVVTAEKARDAQRMGRTFLHFTLAPKGGGLFRQSHPYEPPKPCHYDPLMRGSGAVRARMLIDSVVHNDSSDVYRRNAIEVAALAWDIARFSGAEWEMGPEGRRRRQPLEVLLDLLDAERLEVASASLTPALLQRHHPHLHPVDAETMVRQLQRRAATIKRDVGLKQSTMGSAIADTTSIVSSLLNSSAFYPRSLAVGANPAYQIDLLRAIVRGEIVMFSLSAADYSQEATMLGSMILLDMQNTVSTLREFKMYMDTKLGPDETPWPPVNLQIEELGTAANAASAAALIGLINKSADVGVRTRASTQSLADIRRIEGGVYLQQILALTSDLITLQIGENVDDKDFCDFSGEVTKKIATAETEVSNNRLNIFTGAKQARSVRSADTALPRVDYGAAQGLTNSDEGDVREMIWITKTPKVKAVHTRPEGPNSWFEVIQMVPVDEPPEGYRPFDDPEEVEKAQLAARIEALKRVAYEQQPNSLLGQLRELNERNLDTATVGDVVEDAPTLGDGLDDADLEDTTASGRDAAEGDDAAAEPDVGAELGDGRDESDATADVATEPTEDVEPPPETSPAQEVPPRSSPPRPPQPAAAPRSSSTRETSPTEPNPFSRDSDPFAGGLDD